MKRCARKTNYIVFCFMFNQVHLSISGVHITKLNLCIESTYLLDTNYPSLAGARPIKYGELKIKVNLLCYSPQWADTGDVGVAPVLKTELSIHLSLPAISEDGCDLQLLADCGVVRQ